MSAHVWGESYEIVGNLDNATDVMWEGLTANNLMGAEEFLKSANTNQKIEEIKCREVTKHPNPPKLSRNFRWKGRYIVPDLVDPATGKMGVNIPFTWHAKNGNVQMIAGSKKDPIYFTNLIYKDHLFTYTYKWPGLQPEFLPPLERCIPFAFTLDDLNALLATSFFVGAEILEEKTSHGVKKCIHVHHFRLAVALPNFPPGFYPRIPILSADIYVDQNDSSKFCKVLHFGFQNLYDPNLDEWIVINKFENGPGKIKLPPACSD
jgi:hypothetical protein